MIIVPSGLVVPGGCLFVAGGTSDNFGGTHGRYRGTPVVTDEATGRLCLAANLVADGPKSRMSIRA